MGHFKKFNKGDDTFNRGPGGRPAFRGQDQGPREMFKTTCAECGRAAEVPFRPSGDRPVYCKDCFQTMGGAQSDRGDRGDRRDSRGPSAASFPKRDFAPRPYAPSTTQGMGEDKRLDDLKIQLATAISKLDKLINIMVNSSAPRKESSSQETLQETIASVAPSLAASAKSKKTSASKKKSGASKKK